MPGAGAAPRRDAGGGECAVTTDGDLLEERSVEAARWRARAERAEAAVARVLAECDRANRVTASRNAMLRVSDVRRAITGQASG